MLSSQCLQIMWMVRIKNSKSRNMTIVGLLKWVSHGSIYVNVIRKSNNSANNSSHGIPTKYCLGPWLLDVSEIPKGWPSSLSIIILTLTASGKQLYYYWTKFHVKKEVVWFNWLLPHLGQTWNLTWLEFLQILICKFGHKVAWLYRCNHHIACATQTT